MFTFLLEQKLFLGPMLGSRLSGTRVGDKLHFLPLSKLTFRSLNSIASISPPNNSDDLGVLGWKVSLYFYL